MKKALAIIIPTVIVLLVICGVVIYFVWQSANKQITNIQNLLTITPTISTVYGPDDQSNTTSPSDTTTGTSDACKMLTLDMAQQVIGSDAKLASQNSNNCTYTSLNVGTSSFGVLTIIVSKSNPVTAKSEFEQAKAYTYSSQTEPVSGLNADDAYFATTLKQLSILKGDSWIIISGTSDKFSSEKDLTIEAAKLALN